MHAPPSCRFVGISVSHIFNVSSFQNYERGVVDDRCIAIACVEAAAATAEDGLRSGIGSEYGDDMSGLIGILR